jgi:hypothetical protein
VVIGKTAANAPVTGRGKPSGPVRGSARWSASSAKAAPGCWSASWYWLGVGKDVMRIAWGVLRDA